MQFAFYFDQTRCTTCSTCTVACKDWHYVNPGPVSYRQIHFNIVEGEFPDTATFPLVYSCNHCDDPACVKSCSANAITKCSEDGIVLIDRNKCQGLGNCISACPYGAPKRADTGANINPKVIQEPVKDPKWIVDHPAQKCDACLDRLNAGKQTICVSSCPQRALDFGTVDYIIKKYPTAVKATASNLKYFPSDISAYAPEGTKPNLYVKKR